MSVTISPIDEFTINIHTNIYFLYVTDFVDQEISTENNTIDLHLCYQYSSFPEEGSVNDDSLIDIADLEGEYILQINNANQLNLSLFNTGLLFVKMETNKGIITKKVIKE